MSSSTMAQGPRSTAGCLSKVLVVFFEEDNSQTKATGRYIACRLAASFLAMTGTPWPTRTAAPGSGGQRSIH